MKAKLLLLLALAAGLAVEAKAFTYTSTNYISTNPPPSALRELPIGSLEKVLEYCTNRINNTELVVWYDATELSGGHFPYAGKMWCQYVNAKPCFYDHSEPLGDFIKRNLRDHLNEGIAKGFFVPVKPEPPEEQWFLAGAMCDDSYTKYILDENTCYRGTGGIFRFLNQFKLVKNPDSTFSIPEEASDPVFPGFWIGVTKIHVPGIKDIHVRAVIDGVELLWTAQPHSGNGTLFVNWVETVNFPTKWAFGQYDGTVTIYYSEDKTLYADYDLRTGTKIRDTFPPRLTIVKDKDGKRLCVEGGSGTLYIETSKDCREWNTLRVIENYTGYAWIDGFLGYSDTLFYKAYVE